MEPPCRRLWWSLLTLPIPGRLCDSEQVSGKELVKLLSRVAPRRRDTLLCAP